MESFGLQTLLESTRCLVRGFVHPFGLSGASLIPAPTGAETVLSDRPTRSEP